MLPSQRMGGQPWGGGGGDTWVLPTAPSSKHRSLRLGGSLAHHRDEEDLNVTAMWNSSCHGDAHGDRARVGGGGEAKGY